MATVIIESIIRAVYCFKRSKRGALISGGQLFEGAVNAIFKHLNSLAWVWKVLLPKRRALCTTTKPGF